MPSSLNRLFTKLRKNEGEAPMLERKGSQSLSQSGRSLTRRKWTFGSYISSYNSSSFADSNGCFRKSASMSNCLDGDALTHSSSSSTAIYQRHRLLAASNARSAILPDKLLFLCLDAVENPFELCRMKAVSAQFASYVDSKLERVVESDVRRVNFDQLSLNSHNSSTLCELGAAVVVENETWYMHPAGHKLLMRFVTLPVGDDDANEGESGEDADERQKLKNGLLRVEILTDESWNSKDVLRLHSVLKTFRKGLRKISMDAPIVELVIASLSILDLHRWYAFQCFMKAVNDHQLHLALAHIPTKSNSNVPEEDFFWPNAESLVIRTTERESSHLARILDYGVRSQLVMDRKKLGVLKVVLTDVDKMSREIIRNLYHFRCWAGSAGFDDRFSQQTLRKEMIKAQ